MRFRSCITSPLLLLVLLVAATTIGIWAVSEIRQANRGDVLVGGMVARCRHCQHVTMIEPEWTAFRCSNCQKYQAIGETHGGQPQQPIPSR